MPKISIVMNCYNGERYLNEAIDSIFQQTFSDWELIFWDNASTDNSADIAKSYGEKVRYFCATETSSLGAARALAVDQARGEWIGFLDTDDYWLPHKLERQIDALKEDDYVLCYAGVREVTEQEKTIRTMIPLCKSGFTFPEQLIQFDINMVTPLVNRKFLIDNNFNFSPSITASAEYNLFMRMPVRGKFCIVNEVLGVWRIWPGTLTARQQHRLGDERRFTLDLIRNENPGVQEKYSDEFGYAYARGEYYDACYCVEKGQLAEAKKIMNKIKALDIRYHILSLMLYVPGFWQLAHSKFVKLTLMNGASNWKRRIIGTWNNGSSGKRVS